ncbi:hypothetical protein Pcinc_021973 [Petrolisthes cinctipes]|uniref:Uncharacterized protein n=1 Tax=Petrolisthes cinctipes TaxID=88211 RepID=A0AAE1FF00_PETCI|nr:hypothetical protein Pcinc_021973 [Petrolisthes cinctipes]
MIHMYSSQGRDEPKQSCHNLARHGCERKPHPLTNPAGAITHTCTDQEQIQGLVAAEIRSRFENLGINEQRSHSPSNGKQRSIESLRVCDVVGEVEDTHSSELCDETHSTSMDAAMCHSLRKSVASICRQHHRPHKIPDVDGVLGGKGSRKDLLVKLVAISPSLVLVIESYSGRGSPKCVRFGEVFFSQDI